MPLTEHEGYEECLRKIETTMKYIPIINKRQLQFLLQIMMKEGLENLTLKWVIEGKRSRGETASNLFNEFV